MMMEDEEAEGVQVVQQVVVEQEDVLSVYDQVFANDLIWRELERWMTVSDLKSFCGINRIFNNSVLHYTGFVDRTMMVLQQQDIIESAFGETSVKWKNLTIKPVKTEMQPPPPHHSLTWLWPLLSNVEVLHLWPSKGIVDVDIQYPAMRDILKATVGLQTLYIDLNLMSMYDVRRMLPLHECGSMLDVNLSRVKHLTINKGYVMMPSFAVQNFCGWLYHLSVVMRNLVSFNMCTIIDSNFGQQDNVVMGQYLLMAFLRNNRESLQAVRIDDRHVWASSTDGVLSQNYPIIFPNLRAVCMRINTLDFRYFNNFIHQHGGLVDVDLGVFGYITTSVLITLFRMTRLQTIRIQSDMFGTVPPIVWRGLARLDRLKALSLQLSRTAVTPIVSVEILVACLSKIPASLEHLYLRGFVQSVYQPYVPVVGDFFTLNQCKLQILCLVYNQCWLTDAILHNIYENFTLLRRLEIVKTKWTMRQGVGHGCSEYGITGQRPGQPPGPSIRKLTRLERLVVKGYRGLRDTALVDTFKFPCLRFLDISQNKKLTVVGVRAVVSQCGDLENLITSRLGSVVSTEEIEAMSPRMREYKMLDSDEERGRSIDSDFSDSDESDSDVEIDDVAAGGGGGQGVNVPQ